MNLGRGETMLVTMSAMIFGAPGFELFTAPAEAAAALRWAVAQFQPAQGTGPLIAKAKTLLTALVECAGLTWEFNVRALKDDEDEEALRRELLATLDYIRIARRITSGDAGQDAVNLVHRFDSVLADRLTRAQEAADKPLRELEIATKFLLEDDDADGAVEKEFGLLTPSDNARAEAPVELDLN